MTRDQVQPLSRLGAALNFGSSFNTDYESDEG